MKRSEMLEIILQELRNRELAKYQFEDAINVLPERILTALEKSGMNPPEALIPVNDPYEILVPGCFQNEKNEWCWPRQEWEKE